MKPDDIPKIRRLTRQTRVRNTPTHPGIEGPYWRGHYREHGKRITVHIGKHLPPELFHLLKRRYKAPGATHFTWPRPDEKP